MVGPSVTEADRQSFSLAVRVGFVGLLALSAALIALRGDATLAETALVAATGGGLGVLLVLYFRWADWDIGTTRRRRR
jgi:hypothetical protein